MVTEQQQVQMQPDAVMQPQPVVQTQHYVSPQQVIIVKQQKPYPTFLENKYLIVFIILGVIFLLIGAIMVNIAPEMKNKEYSGTDAAKDLADDTRASLSMTHYGNVFKSIGVFFIFAFILMAAVLRTDLSDYTRFGLLLLLGLIMFATSFTIP